MPNQVTRKQDKNSLQTEPSKKETFSDSDISINELKEHTDSNDTDDVDTIDNVNIYFAVKMPVFGVLGSLKPSNRKKNNIFTMTLNKEELGIRETIRKKKISSK